VAEQTLDEVAVWLQDGASTIQDEATRDLLEGLVLDKLYQLLSHEAQQLLQWSQDFVMPLPITALNALQTGEAVQSLFTLGLWDGWRDEVTLQPAAMLNQLAKRLCVAVDTEQLPTIAQKLLSPLWAVWQDAERPDQADCQLTRLAVRLAETAILEKVAGNGVRWACKMVSFIEGKALGTQAIAQLEAAGLTPNNRLLYYSAESCWRTGDIQQSAVIQGRIADILQARGELDKALNIRVQEELSVYERFGDVYSSAVTKSKIADILEARGELEEALRMHREEVLPVFERWGDIQQYAVIQGKIADILQSHGELDKALRIRTQEQLPVYEHLSDVCKRTMT